MKRLPLLALILLLLAPECWGQQLVVPEVTAPGKIARFKIEGLAEGSKVLWRIDAAADVVKASGDRAYGAGLPGVHPVEVFVSPPGDGEPIILIQQWTVGDKPTPPPAPVKTLADLVTPEQAPLLAEFYADLANGVALVKTPAQFQSAHAAALAAASVQSGVELVGHGALAEVNKRIDAAIGTATTELTAAQRTALVACLKKISAEFGKPTPPPKPPGPTDPVTAATYIYEKDDTAVPSGVLVGLDRLNRERHILATPFEEDTLDGSGAVPDQYKVPLAAARKEGLPALVVTAGDNVLKVVKSPTTEAAVMEAVQ